MRILHTGTFFFYRDSGQQSFVESLKYIHPTEEITNCYNSYGRISHPVALDQMPANLCNSLVLFFLALGRFTKLNGFQCAVPTGNRRARPSMSLSSTQRKTGNTNDEDSVQSKKRIRNAQLNAIVNPKKALVRKRKDGEAASAAMNLPNQPLVKTIQGGSSLMFEAARQNVPRWHPTNGVSDINPNFRTQSPVMNAQGYAASIWKNSRKRQPAMWRYAIRTYDRLMEQQQSKSGPKIEITNIHYEGALTAAAKLGWSERAFHIFEAVKHNEEKYREKAQSQTNGNTKQRTMVLVKITENMVLSVIRACVREAIREKSRAPLDSAQKLVETAEVLHGIPATAIHWNPIASAYQSLGFSQEANAVLLSNLADRVGGPEAENLFDNSFNVYDVQAKDKGSYSLLVNSAVCEQDWGGAVEALKTMTEAGLFPANRHLNTWTEISEKRRKTSRGS